MSHYFTLTGFFTHAEFVTLNSIHTYVLNHFIHSFVAIVEARDCWMYLLLSLVQQLVGANESTRG